MDPTNAAPIEPPSTQPIDIAALRAQSTAGGADHDAENDVADVGDD